jgi:hypothetical protein
MLRTVSNLRTRAECCTCSLRAMTSLHGAGFFLTGFNQGVNRLVVPPTQSVAPCNPHGLILIWRLTSSRGYALLRGRSVRALSIRYVAFIDLQVAKVSCGHLGLAV